MRSKRVVLLLLSLLLAGAACDTPRLPDDLPDPEAVATAVVQTLEAGLGGDLGFPDSVPDDQAIPTVGPEAVPDKPPQKPPTTIEPLDVPPFCPQASVLTIVYTDGGNIWAIQGNNAPVQLTSGGNAERVRISRDGLKIAFTTWDPGSNTYKLRAVNIDGSGKSVLLSQADLTSLEPLGPNALGNAVYQFDFKPCSQDLLFNTRANLSGPGLVTHDNLYSIDTTTGAVSPILPAGMGGSFTVSPDGSKIALTKPESLSFANIDGSGYLPDVHTYTRVLTESEFWWSPPVRWAPNSASVGLAMPSENLFDPAAYAELWNIPADGSPAALLGTITGAFYFLQWRDPAFAPDLSKVVFLRHDPSNPNFEDIYFANPDGSGEVSYAYAMITFLAWSPDSETIAYWFEDKGGSYLMAGRAGFPPVTLDSGLPHSSGRWVTPHKLLYVRGQYPTFDLVLWTLGSGTTTLASPTPVTGGVQFDFAPKP